MQLAALSDQDLLSLRICDLPCLKGGVSPRLRPFVDGLHAELAAAGCRHFRPEVYLGDEWFSPDGVPKIAVPFYLAHPRLAELERCMMREVEGGTPRDLRRLLRHEAGHAFDHAYAVSKTKAWRQIFGAPPRDYNPDVYLPDPATRDFVQHLPGFYAQAHPDEDFAETFAVVVTPRSDWHRRYRNWPGALRKLIFTHELIQRLGKRKPAVDDGPECFLASRLRRRLGNHYEQRQAAAERHRIAVKKLAAADSLPKRSWTH